MKEEEEGKRAQRSMEEGKRDHKMTRRMLGVITITNHEHGHSEGSKAEYAGQNKTH